MSAVRQPELYVSVVMSRDVAKYPHVWLWTIRQTPEYPCNERASMFALAIIPNGSGAVTGVTNSGDATSKSLKIK